MPVQVVLRNVQHRRRRGLEARATPSSWKLDSSSTQTSGSSPASICAGPGCRAAWGRCCRPRPRSCPRLHQQAGERGHRGLAIGAGDGQHGRRIAMRCTQRAQGHGIQAQFASSAYSTGASSYRQTGATARPDSGRASGTPRCRLRHRARPHRRLLRQNAPGAAPAAAKASCGGASRVSATVTWAPQRTHQRAMARPEAPRPSTSTCWPCSGLRPRQRPPRVRGAARGRRLGRSAAASVTAGAAAGALLGGVPRRQRCAPQRRCLARGGQRSSWAPR